MSFAAPMRERSRPVLPLAAMVDILFLLLIFFMTVSVFREQDVYVEVAPPAIESGQPGTGGSAIIITVTGDGDIYIGDRRFTLPELRAALNDLSQQFANEPVYIRGDESATHGRVMQVKDTIFESGFTNVYDAVVKKAQ